MWVVFLIGALVFAGVALIIILAGSRIYLSIKRQNKKFEIEEAAMDAAKQTIKEKKR